MTLFVSNIGLALIWAILTGRFSPANLAIGFFLGYLALRAVRRVLKPSQYFSTLPKFFEFAGYFIWELILANWRLAFDVLTPRHRMKPRVLAVPLDVRTEGEITLLANLISLTPGSLSLDVSSDRSVLYVHAMYASDSDAVRQSIKTGLERRVIELVRGTERDMPNG
jgi:multicomponent Na+:H+ antiporter subunit E